MPFALPSRFSKSLPCEPVVGNNIVCASASHLTRCVSMMIGVSMVHLSQTKVSDIGVVSLAEVHLLWTRKRLEEGHPETLSGFVLNVSYSKS